MHQIDYGVFAVYFLTILYIGYFYYKKNKTQEDHYVGGRNIKAGHLGLSIAATDVGGGFSIGLGGLGFSMGIAGSWLLFTGLAGAWLAAILTVPKLKRLDEKHSFLTFPDFLTYKYNKKVGTLAAIISGIGYVGFTSGQLLAGGKLAAGSIFAQMRWMPPLEFSLLMMAAVVIIYTTLGGLKAVVYTDTAQWIILLAGLLFLGIPFAYQKLGGWQAIREALPEQHFDITHISWVTLVNWSFSIIPIWFIAMTLYQRVFASPNVKEAKKAFYIAGIFEYPLMAFSGVALGMLARVAFPEGDSETALAMLLESTLPIGVAGLVLASYFSAIMSTADSCLIAASANFEKDLSGTVLLKQLSQTQPVRVSQVFTLALGIVAFLLATWFTSVLELILHAYAFMVSGLLVPTLFAYFGREMDSKAAMWSMLMGGTITLIMLLFSIQLPFGLDATISGIAISLITFITVRKPATKNV